MGTVLMRKTFRYGILALSAAFVCLLSGCGAEKKHQIGVDGYVYVGETIVKDYGESSRYTVAGDSLYYLQKANSIDSLYYQQGANSVKRIALEEFLDRGDLSGAETVFTMGGALFSMENAEDFHMAGIWDYAVDEEGSIYCILAVRKGIFSGEEDEWNSGKGILCKQYADGEIAYRIQLPELRILWDNSDWLALDGQGRAYVLTAEAILVVDTDGTVKGNLPVELAADPYDKRGASGRLLEGENGAVYYVKDELGISITETYLLNEGETLRMTPVSFLSARSGLNLFEGTDGILRMTSEGLYRCDVAGSTMEEILKWGDSNLIANNIYTVVQIADGRYMVTIPTLIERDGKAETGIESRLLSRTPVEELPERENIFIASLYPSDDLRRCAVEFNLASEKYHVSIETYSGDPEGKYVRLDADLVSRDTPDLLDLSGLDVSKYADREML